MSELSEQNQNISSKTLLQIIEIIKNDLGQGVQESDVKNMVDRIIPNLNKFRNIKGYQDPIVPEQKFCVVTFDPATGATANSTGVLAWVKPRRFFSDEEEAAKYASELVEKDPHHSNFIVHTGQYFPVELDPQAEEVQQVEIQKNMVESVSETIRNRSKQDKQKITEIENRAQSLMDKTNRQEGVDNDEDDLTKYKRYHEARMFNISRYMQALEMIQEGRKSIKKYRQFILDMDSNDSKLRIKFLKDWKDARNKVGFDVETNTNFARYMEEDLEIPGVDIPLHVEPFENSSLVSVVVPTIIEEDEEKDEDEEKVEYGVEETKA